MRYLLTIIVAVMLAAPAYAKELSLMPPFSTLRDDTKIPVFDKYSGAQAVTIGAIKTAVGNSGNVEKNVLDYGAKGDALYFYDGAIASGDKTFTSSSATFTGADIGKKIIVVEGLANYLNLETTITSLNNPHSVELADAAGRTVAGSEFVYGTDDGPAVQAIINTYGKAYNIDADILKPTPIVSILFTGNKNYMLFTGVTVDSKAFIEFDGDGTIVFPDIKAISIQYSRYITIKNLRFDGMVYDKLIASPANSAAIYIGGTPAYVLYPTRNRTIKIEDNFILRCKYGIGGQGGFTGVESIIRGNKIKQQAILDSVGILVSTTDNKITANVINESRIGIQISGKDLTAFTHNHFYPGGAYGNLELYGSTTSGSNVFTVDGSATNINWLNHLYQSVGRWLQVSAGLPASYTYNGNPTTWYRVSAVSPVVPAWDQYKGGGYHVGDKVWLNSGWYQCTVNNNPAQPVTNTSYWSVTSTPTFTVTLKKADGTDATATSSTTGTQAKAYIMKHNLYSTNGTRISNISFNEFDHADDYMVNIVDPGAGWTFSSNTMGLTGLYANAKFMQVDFTAGGGTLDSWSVVNNTITDGQSTTDYNREMITFGANVDIANSRDLDIRGNGQEQDGDKQVSMRTIAHYRDDYLKDDSNNSQPMLALTGRFGGGKVASLLSVENRDNSVYGVPITLRKSRLGGATSAGDFGGSVRFQYHDGTSFKTRAGLDSELLSTDGSSLLYMQTTRPSASNTTAALQLDEEQNAHLGGALITTTNAGNGARHSLLLGNNAAAPSSGITDKVALYGADIAGAGTTGLQIKTEDNKVWAFGSALWFPDGTTMTTATAANGTTGSVQISDGSGVFTSDTSVKVVGGTLQTGPLVVKSGTTTKISLYNSGGADFTGTVDAPGITISGTAIASSVFGRNGAVTAASGDYTKEQITGLTTADSPQFTGMLLSAGSTTPLTTQNVNNSPQASILWKNARASGAALTTATQLGYIAVSGATSTNTYDAARGVFVVTPTETWSDAAGATTGAFKVDFRTRIAQSGQSTMNGVTTRLTLPADGGMQLATATEQTCDSSHRGVFNYVAGGAGVKDTVKVCAKDAADSYAWRTIY